jgi:hypothetical protein
MEQNTLASQQIYWSKTERQVFVQLTTPIFALLFFYQYGCYRFMFGGESNFRSATRNIGFLCEMDKCVFMG